MSNMGWKLRCILWLTLALLPAPALAKRIGPYWNANVALAELAGKPVVAYTPAPQPGPGTRQPLVIAYAKVAQPTGPEDWTSVAVNDPLLLASGKEYVQTIELIPANGGLSYAIYACYTAPGNRLRYGWLWGTAPPPGTNWPAAVEATGGTGRRQEWQEMALLEGRPLFPESREQFRPAEYSGLLQYRYAHGREPSTEAGWQLGELDHAGNFSQLAFAVDDRAVYACYWADYADPGRHSGLRLQLGELQQDGTLKWSAVQLPARLDTLHGQTQAQIAGGQLWLFCCSAWDGLHMAHCALDQLSQQQWQYSDMADDHSSGLQSCVIANDVPYILYNEFIPSGGIGLNLAFPGPRQPPGLQAWSHVVFPSQAWSGALAVIAGKPALVYQTEAPCGVAYARAITAQPQVAADWQVSMLAYQPDAQTAEGAFGVEAPTAAAKPQLSSPYDISATITGEAPGSAQAVLPPARQTQPPAVTEDLPVWTVLVLVLAFIGIPALLAFIPDAIKRRKNKGS